MALIAIPIGAASEYRSAIRSALQPLPFSLASERRLEPMLVLGSKADGWGSDRVDQNLIEGGFLLAGDGSLSDRIREGVNTIQSRRLRLEYQSRDAGPSSDTPPPSQPRPSDIAPPTVIVPIIRLADRAGLDALREMISAVDVALEPLATRLVARQLSASAFAYVPWIQLEPELARTEPDRALFHGPTRIRGGKCVPILHVNADPLESWNESGRIRLLADLLALFGFSAMPEAASWFSPTNWAGDTFHTFNTSFVELPMARAQRRRALKQIEEALLEAPRDDMPLPDARDAVRSLADLVNGDDVDYKAFCSGDNPFGVVVDLTPDRTDFLTVSASRKSETLHGRAVEAVRGAVSTEIRRIAGDKLREFRTELTQKETIFEGIIQGLIDDNKRPLNESFEAAMQFCDALAAALPPPAADGGAADVNDLVRQAVGWRGGWVAREEALLQDGRRIPSPLSVWISAGIIAIGCALAGFVAGEAFVLWRGMSEAWAYVITAVAALSGAILYWHSREGAVREYFDLWRSFEASIGSALTSVTHEVARITNRRLRGMKTAALPGLARGLHAVRVRLHTERAGLRSQIRRERESVLDDEPEKPHLGWFRVNASGGSDGIGERSLSRQPNAESEALPSEAAGFLRTLLRDVVTLHDWPKPLEVWKHVEALRLSVERCGAGIETDREAASRRIADAIRYARDRRVNVDFEDNRTFTVQRAGEVRVFVPPAMRALVEHELSTFEWPVPELVVVTNVQSYALKAVEE